MKNYYITIMLGLLLAVIIPVVADYVITSEGPETWVFEVHRFEPESVVCGQTSHSILFDRTIRSTLINYVNNEELLLVDGKNVNTIIDSKVLRKVTPIEQGKHTYLIHRDLPPDLSVGEYYYVWVLEAVFPNGARRTFTFISDKFRICE